jgi:antitoxin component of RelBE/YafQ-DinJ toxin-antitoxin module
MSETTIEIRIDLQGKQAAQERAKAQGVTLSEAVRRLLELWTSGAIDMGALERLPATVKNTRDAMIDLDDNLDALLADLDKATPIIEENDWEAKALLQLVQEMQEVVEEDDSPCPICGRPWGTKGARQ